MSTLVARARHWASHLKCNVVALWIAARDHRTPLLAKIVAAAVAAYALSPIDLIPDVVPVLGYFDDLLIVPLGLLLAIRLVPSPLMAEFRAAAFLRRDRPVSRAGMATVIVLWFAAAAGLVWFAVRYTYNRLN